jgi:hypothetical protein
LLASVYAAHSIANEPGMTVPELSPDDFGPFFRAIHGVDPFPWQARLLRQIAGERIWPDVLDLPTGSGKTAALDIAVFHLALEAAKGSDAGYRSGSLLWSTVG